MNVNNTIKKIITLIFILIFSISYNFSIKIIHRSERGADESIRFSDYPKYKWLIEEEKKYIVNLKKHKNLYEKYLKKQKIEKTRNEYLVKFWKDEFKIDKVITIQSGHHLRWPLQYHFNKTKIVIHHTTNDLTKYKSPNDVKKLLNGIYHWHALTRGRGDIGYNYVIGPFGNIYEGRAGGDGVIGAHAKRNNPASIGIALIGNFNIQKPTKKQLKSLIDLLTYLSKKYNINPLQDITWHKPILGKNAHPPYIKDIKLPTIVGHRDVGHTSCPGKNLYELLPWIRQQVWKNLNKIKLTSYSHKTNEKEEKKITLSKNFFIKSNGNFDIKLNIGNIEKCTTKDNHFQIISCYSHNGILHLKLKRIKFLASGKKQLIIETKSLKYLIDIKLLFENDLNYLLRKLKNEYIKKYHINLAKYKTQKIKYKIPLNQAIKLLNGFISILLYDLSLNYNYYNISCNTKCEGVMDNIIKIKNIKNLKIYKESNYLKISINNSKFLKAKSLILKGNLIIFNNYKRKSYSGIPWNSFRNEIIIKKDYIKLLNGKIIKQFVVINKLLVKDYLKGIAEVNDQTPEEKNKAMALVIKSYTLFYLKNKHPYIPDGSSYQAIDDARIFQKYVGAGFEKTSKKWLKALKDTEKEIILYNGYIPILPYFNCSAGFTFSAEEKFGRTDTPYLKSTLDFYKCEKFKGHGVGLSGKGAEILAKKGLNYKQILKRYYKGIKITQIR